MAAAFLVSGPSAAFSLDDVDAKAKELSAKAYSAPTSNLPTALRQMKFVDYQKIRFRDDKAEWMDIKTPFKLNFYHQGMHYDTPVRINEVTATSTHRIEYDRNRFDFADLSVDEAATRDLGYAGFRVQYPLNGKDKSDEVLSMLGASYFRVIGKGQVYGLSARGLAIDTAVSSGEEFPRFTEYWIERPKPEDKHLVIYALLDSPRATGAYRFILRMRDEAVLDVKARVYLRAEVSKLGIAPLTSMFLFGSHQPSSQVNYRPQLHDSEGLSIQDGNGQWLYRPLNNPRRLSLSSYPAENPKGFGLLQRSRAFSDYEDLDDHYEKRPSAWIEPQGDWGKGRFELVEIPTPDETNDNIVAFWVPENMPKVGEPFEFSYRTYWTMDEAAHHDQDVAWVKQTLRSAGDVRQSNLVRQPDGSTALLVDFVGPKLAELPADAPVSTQVTTDENTELLQNELRYNEATKGWRLTLRVKLKDPTKPVVLRAHLIQGEDVLSETWSYQLPANE
ncbi:glucan biosynthesis protein G [Pseudomonas matsuisoli]|uniref:Glucans biosynthesis protein G n=1 Tax=Pseudomonas matsuisoli TaxID=1515666 RepID=A0A917UZE0_9PSED|nr:glucan biosynthesis protein G [Pseudomonas matsuisoli]GGJ99461.1 glucans biosynthesis protein G [Pseudomonas matsuisoli]